MPFNGSGTYSAPSSSFNPAVAGTTIDPTAWNTLLTDISTALSTTILKNGTQATTALIPFANGISADTITEFTAGVGVTADGVLLKDGAVTETSTDAGAAAAPVHILDRNSASPAASDVLGAISFKGRDSGAGTDVYAQAQASIVDPTAASEDGSFEIQTVVAGTLATRFYVRNGIVVGSATGGDQGAGTLNATALYINGVAVGTTVPTSGVTFTTSDRVLGRDTAGSGAGEELTLSQVLDFVGSPAQGDVLYRGAATWTRLGAGTSGHFLQTQGAGANPQWAAAGSATITLGTATSASGTSVDITGISASAKCIIITHAGLSTNGSSQYLVQIGDSGGIENTGYSSQMADNGGSASSTAGFNLTRGADSNTSLSGTVMINLVNSATNLWAASWVNGDGAASTTPARGGGQKTLSATLDRVRITTAGGTDTFDAGTINILVLA